MELEMDRLISMMLLQKEYSFKYPLCTNIYASPRLVSQFKKSGQVWLKYKNKVPDMSDTNQNIGTSCKSKLKLTELKDLCNKGAKKLVKEECM